MSRQNKFSQYSVGVRPCSSDGLSTVDRLTDGGRGRDVDCADRRDPQAGPQLEKQRGGITCCLTARCVR